MSDTNKARLIVIGSLLVFYAAIILDGFIGRWL